MRHCFIIVQRCTRHAGNRFIGTVLGWGWTCLAAMRLGGALALRRLSDSPVKGERVRPAAPCANRLLVNWKGVTRLSACLL